MIRFRSARLRSGNDHRALAGPRSARAARFALGGSLSMLLTALAPACVLLHTPGTGGEGGAGAGEVPGGAGASGAAGPSTGGAGGSLDLLPTLQAHLADVSCEAVKDGPCVMVAVAGEAGPVAVEGSVVRFLAGTNVMSAEGEVLASLPTSVQLTDEPIYMSTRALRACVSGPGVSGVFDCDMDSCAAVEPIGPPAMGYGGCAYAGTGGGLHFVYKDQDGTKLISPQSPPTEVELTSAPTQMIADGIGVRWGHLGTDAPLVSWNGNLATTRSYGVNDLRAVALATSAVYVRADSDDGGGDLARAGLDMDSLAAFNEDVANRAGNSFVHVAGAGVFADGGASDESVREAVWRCNLSLSECQELDDPWVPLPSEFARVDAIAGLAGEQLRVYATIGIRGGLQSFTVLVRVN